jgi:hypothetical protein
VFFNIQFPICNIRILPGGFVLRFRLALTLIAAGVLSGCLASSTVIHVNADGTGTIESLTTMNPAALAQLRQMASGLSGRPEQKSFDPFATDKWQAAAAKMGEGVTLVSADRVATSDVEGMKAVYAFRDISKVTLNQRPDIGDGVSGRVGGLSLGGGGPEDVSFRLNRQAGGNAVLTVVFPAPAGSAPSSVAAGAGGQVDGMKSASPQTLLILQQLLKGLKISIVVEPNGRLVRTTSPFVDGEKVTLLDLDFDALVADPERLLAMQNVTSVEQAKQTLRDVPGVKVNQEREVTIEFVPR